MNIIKLHCKISISFYIFCNMLFLNIYIIFAWFYTCCLLVISGLHEKFESISHRISGVIRSPDEGVGGEVRASHCSQFQALLGQWRNACCVKAGWTWEWCSARRHHDQSTYRAQDRGHFFAGRRQNGSDIHPFEATDRQHAEIVYMRKAGAPISSPGCVALSKAIASLR